MAQHQQQMSFADIGTLYNTVSNELEGGVTAKNQDLLLNQVSTVQTQLQGLIDGGAFDNLDGTSIVHAQNIADQMNFLKSEIANFGKNAFDPKFINDVVRDVQDIVAGDAGLSALAQQGNHSGFQQVSFLLTPPTPFPDTPLQTDTLLKFVSDSNSLAQRALALEGTDPHSADVQQLIADINTFSTNADAYSTAQGGLFSARFNNEFTLNGVQGTASRELVTGLETGDTKLIDGAAAVLMANAQDVRGNMLAQGDTFTPAPNGGIPDVINTVHDAGAVFNDAVTKLLGGVYSGNQQSILNDLHATSTGLQNAITEQGITGSALAHINKVIGLLDNEASLVTSIDTAAPTQVSATNGQINTVEAQILKIVNNDASLAKLAAGTDGTTGFVALPPDTGKGQGVAGNGQGGNGQGVAGNGQGGNGQGVAGNGQVGNGQGVADNGHGDSGQGIADNGHGVVAPHQFDHMWG
jgi:hypothetical protein